MASQESNPESPSAGNTKDAMFEPKPKPKMIRVLTVLAYVLSVSMAAILLSIYYIFMWDGRPHLGARRSFGEEMMEPNNFTNDTKNYVLPIFSKQVSSQDDMYNFIKEKLANNGTQEDDLNLVNGTNEDYSDKFKSTTMELINNDDENNELQQQITAIEVNDEAIVSSSTVPTTTSEETSVTWPDDYDQEEKKNIFLKKMLDDDY